MSILPTVKTIAIALATAAGGLAALGILLDSGARAPWLKTWHLNWTVSSDALAQRAYDEFLAGRSKEGLSWLDLALRRDPASPYRWCDYGEALLMAGDQERARQALRRGVELGPYVAPIRMRAVNVAYRIGDQRWALEEGRHLLAITDRYDDPVFRVWGRMEAPAEAAFQSGIPDARAARSYLRHLVRAASLDGAQQAWALSLAKGFVDDKLADEYARFVLQQHQYGPAASAWTAYAGGREPGYPYQSAVFNGGFEREPIGGVFDWRMDPVAGVRVERDRSVADTGQSSLRVEFDGTENIAFGHVSQRVVLAPGDWDFTARMRTEGITTDQGLRMRLFDPEDPKRLDAATENLTGTRDWCDLAARFTVPGATNLVEIRLVRNSTWKFDRRIRGTAWVDTVVLRRASRLATMR